ETAADGAAPGRCTSRDDRPIQRKAETETFASMKILYIAQERSAALEGARVVRGIAQNVRVTWAPTPAAALKWLQSNRDASAVIVEVQAQSCSFIQQLRELGLTTAVVVIA